MNSRVTVTARLPLSPEAAAKLQTVKARLLDMGAVTVSRWSCDDEVRVSGTLPISDVNLIHALEA